MAVLAVTLVCALWHAARSSEPGGETAERERGRGEIAEARSNSVLLRDIEKSRIQERRIILSLSLSLSLPLESPESIDRNVRADFYTLLLPRGILFLVVASFLSHRRRWTE